MSSDEPVDPLTLRMAARSERKSLGRLSRLVASSVELVWSAERRLFVALVILQLIAAGALAAQVLAVQAVLDAILLTQSTDGVGQVVAPVLALAGLTALTAITGPRLQPE